MLTTPYSRGLLVSFPRKTSSENLAVEEFFSTQSLTKNHRTNMPLSYLLMEFVRPLPRAGQMLPLGLLALPLQPLIGVVVHLFWPPRKRLHHVRATTEAHPDLLRPPQGLVFLVLALAPVAQVIAMPA